MTSNCSIPKMNYYQKHIFICTNVKSDDRQCCSQGGAEAAFDFAKSRLKQLDLFGAGKIRVSKTGCLGRCKVGPAIVIYPEGVWYTYHGIEDVSEIIESHVVGGKKVERLLI